MTSAVRAPDLPRRSRSAQRLGIIYCSVFSAYSVVRIFQRDLELFRTDGTIHGTVKISSPLFINGAEQIDDVLYFSGSPSGAETGHELATSDGTAEGTKLLFDIYPGPYSSWPREFTKFQNAIWFSASDGFHGTELWKYSP